MDQVSHLSTRHQGSSLTPIMAPIPSTSHSHRPTQKQQNKPFKSKHSTKSSLKDAAKGRTHRPSLKSHPKITNAMLSASHSKLNRRNHAKQILEKKKDQLEELGKLFTKRNGAERVSRVVAVVPLTKDVSALEIVEQLLAAVGVESVGTGAVRTGE